VDVHRRDALRSGAALLGAGLLAPAASASDGTDATFSPRGRLPIRGAKEAVVSDDGSVAYLALTDGYATVDLSDPANPTVLAERRDLLADRDDGPMQGIFDVKLSGGTLAVAGPANPVRGDALTGVLLVDVSDPADPSQLGFYGTEFAIHNCFFDGSHLYLTGNGAGEDGENPMVSVDARGDEPTEVARWSLAGAIEEWAEVPSAFRTLHDLWVRDGLAALAYWDAGTYLVDVSDPTAPELLGSIEAIPREDLITATNDQYTSSPGNHHYVATDEANELLAVGGESWGVDTGDGFRGGPSGIDLYDVSDPAAPTKLSSIEPPETRNPTYSGTWTTSHNFELRDGTLYSSWYQGGVKRHDVSDPANPREASWWADPGTSSFWTAQAGVPGEFLVASTRGADDGDAGLWTFPDADGTGGNPEMLTQTPTPLFSPTPSPTATPTDSPTRTDTASPSPTPSPSPTDSPTPTSANSPGFGALAGLAALGAGAVRLWRDGDEE
jgi:PGF-CTERM protein